MVHFWGPGPRNDDSQQCNSCELGDELGKMEGPLLILWSRLDFQFQKADTPRPTNELNKIPRGLPSLRASDMVFLLVDLIFAEGIPEKSSWTLD